MRRLRLPRDIKQINPHEDDEETAKEGNGVDSAGGVEALE